MCHLEEYLGSSIWDIPKIFLLLISHLMVKQTNKQTLALYVFESSKFAEIGFMIQNAVHLGDYSIYS